MAIIFSAFPLAFTNEDGTINAARAYNFCKKFPKYVIEPELNREFLEKIGLTPEEWTERFLKAVKEYEDSLQ